MSVEEFDAALAKAARDVHFGPLNGFGGYGSDRVWANLPAPIQALYTRWNLPRQILAGRSPGNVVRDYAKACGIPVEADLASLKT